jgi:hypothetical protein
MEGGRTQLVAAVIMEVGMLLIMIYVPLLQAALGTVALPWESWAALYAVVPIVVSLGSAGKVGWSAGWEAGSGRGCKGSH